MLAVILIVVLLILVALFWLSSISPLFKDKPKNYDNKKNWYD